MSSYEVPLSYLRCCLCTLQPWANCDLASAHSILVYFWKCPGKGIILHVLFIPAFTLLAPPSHNFQTYFKLVKCKAVRNDQDCVLWPGCILFVYLLGWWAIVQLLAIELCALYQSVCRDGCFQPLSWRPRRAPAGSGDSYLSLLCSAFSEIIQKFWSDSILLKKKSAKTHEIYIHLQV